MTTPQAPALTMLWEAHDPRHALDGRFGFGDSASAGRWITATLRQCWGVRVQSCERIVISAHNALAWVGTSSGRLVAKWSALPDRYPHLFEVARVTHWLHGQGLPVSAPVLALDGHPQVEVDGVSMSLQHEVVGDFLDVTDPDQVRATGAVLARMQEALAAYPDADRLTGYTAAPRSLPDRIEDWLDSGAQHLPSTARDTLGWLVADAPTTELPAQLVHDDFRSANILCGAAGVAAILDFESMTVDHRVAELARSAVKLGTLFHNWGPVSPEVHAWYLEGYQSVRQLSSVEAAWWNILLLWQALAFVPAGGDPTGWGPAAFDYLAGHAPRAP